MSGAHSVQGAAAIIRVALVAVTRERRLSLSFVAMSGVGLGVFLTMATLIEIMLVSPPSGVAEPRQLRRVVPVRQVGSFAHAPVFSVQELEHLRSSVPQLAFGGYATTDLDLDVDQRLRTLRGASVTGNYFALLGNPIHSGRAISADDDRESGMFAVVISDALWRGALRRSSRILGSHVRINGALGVIVGIAIPGFVGVGLEPADVWIPRASGPVFFGGPDNHAAHLFAFARSQRGEFPEPGNLEQVIKRDSDGFGVRYTSLTRSSPPADSRDTRAFALSLGLGICALLLGFANCAVLWTIGIEERRANWEIRRLLGATWKHIFLELFTRIGLLTIAGLVAGLILQEIVSVHFEHLGLSALPLAARIRVLSYTALAATAMALIILCFAIRPLLPHSMSGGAARLDESAWNRGLPVALYVGVGTTLLLTMAPIWSTFGSLTTLDHGFETPNLHVATIAPSGPRPTTVELRRAEDVRGRLARVSGVRAVALATGFPYKALTAISVHQPSISNAFQTGAWYVDEHFVATLGLRRIGTVPGAPSNNNVSVNRAFLGKHHAASQCVMLETTCLGISAVLSDFDVATVGDTRTPMALLPLRLAEDVRQMFFAVRLASGSTSAAIGGIHRILSDEYGHTRVESVQRMIVERTDCLRRLSVVTALFALAAMTLVWLGIRTCATKFVSRRRYRLGIMAALGCPPRSIALAMTFEQAPPVLIGMLFGSGAGIASARLLGAIIPLAQTAVWSHIAASAAFGLILLAAQYPLCAGALRLSPHALLNSR